MKRAFTLLELMIAVALMGFLGTVTVGGYRAMRRGMEERGVIDNANQFVRAAYQRSLIDRQPVAVYYWNETLRKADSDAQAVVVGKAVAIRRCGRISRVDSTHLYDEFSDLIVDESGDSDDSSSSTLSQSAAGAGTFVYKLNGDESSPQRTTVYEIPSIRTLTIQIPGNDDSEKLKCYTYEIKDPGGVSWKAGDAYGFEFASLQLPHGFLFGSSWDRAAGGVTSPQALLFKGQSGAAGNDTLQISSLRPGKSGSIEALPVGTTTSPTQELKD